MLSEAPSGAAPACVAELVRVAAGPDRAFQTRRRGARWRSRAGLFASRLSTFAALFVCLRGCLLAMSPSSGSTPPIAMLAPPEARHLEPGAVATQEEPSTR